MIYLSALILDLFHITLILLSYYYCSQPHFVFIFAGLLLGIPVLKNIKRLEWEKTLGWVTLAVYLAFVAFAILFNTLYKDYPPIDWDWELWGNACYVTRIGCLMLLFSSVRRDPKCFYRQLKMKCEQESISVFFAMHWIQVACRNVVIIPCHQRLPLKCIWRHLLLHIIISFSRNTNCSGFVSQVFACIVTYFTGLIYYV